MTINQMRKADLDNLYAKIDINKIDEGALFALKKVVETELYTSIRVEFNEPHLTMRNITCFDNCMNCIAQNKMENAWWEMVDIISYKNSDDFITTNELMLIKIALDKIIQNLQ